MEFAYWLILVLSAFFPIYRSFGSPLRFHKKWKFLWPAILITAIPFLIWDALFTAKGIWGFNTQYITGFKIAGLPLEEISFFIVIPYCCMFIYEVVSIRVKPFIQDCRIINSLLTILFVTLMIVYRQHSYTLIASGTAFFMLLLHWRFQPEILSLFYTSFVFMLIPFLVVNGILTGAGLEEPIVWYNDSENLGIRLYTIPLDDFIYCFGMMLSVVGVYEFLLKRAESRIS